MRRRSRYRGFSTLEIATVYGAPVGPVLCLPGPTRSAGKSNPRTRRSLMHGVAPHMCGQVARPLLGGGAGGRSPGVLAAGCVADRCDRLRCSEQSGSTVTAITVSPRFQLSGTEAGYGFTYNPPYGLRALRSSGIGKRSGFPCWSHFLTPTGCPLRPNKGSVRKML
jgi:hypothetical protein